MEVLEKISALILQVTGDMSSWRTIFTNIVAVFITFISRNTIRAFYATLDAMNDFVSNSIFVLLALSLYGLIFKSVSAAFSFGQRYLERRRSRRLELRLFEKLKNSISSLSKNEIATLKFLAAQHSLSAWLPRGNTSVVLLREKGFIKPLGKHIKSICDNQKDFHDALSEAILFTVPDNVRNILADMPPELATRWHNTKLNNSFAQFQN